MAISREEKDRRTAATGVFWHLYRSFVGWMVFAIISIPLLLWGLLFTVQTFNQQAGKRAVADRQSQIAQFLVASPEHPVLVIFQGYGPEQPKPLPSGAVLDNGAVYMDSGAIRCVVGYDVPTDNVEFVSKGPGGRAYYARPEFQLVSSPSQADLDKACRGAT